MDTFTLHKFNVFVITMFSLHAMMSDVPIHGGWGEWSPSGGCSASCGGGMMRYERKCDSPSPQHGGNPCSGADFKLEECNTNCCPGELHDME